MFTYISKKERSFIPLLCLLLALALSFPGPGVRAASRGMLVPQTMMGNGLWWSLTEEGLLTIGGNGDMEDYFQSATRRSGKEQKEVELVFHTTAPWALIFMDVQAVVVEEGVTSLGNYAFWGCPAKNFTLPESLTSIGDYAFGLCEEVEEIHLSANVKEMGANPFAACRKLKNLEIAEENEAFVFEDGALYDSSRKNLLCYLGEGENGVYTVPAGTKAIGRGALFGKEDIREIHLPEGLKEIGEWAFFGCGFLELSIPDSVKTLGPYVCQNCHELTSAVLPTGISYLPDGVFYGCENLSTAWVRNSVWENVGSYAFWRCDQLVILCGENSFMEEYCQEMELPYELIQDDYVMVWPITTEMSYEEELQLKVTGAYEKVTYKSSAPEVAMVDKNGLVIAHDSGEATITVKVDDRKLKVEIEVL